MTGITAPGATGGTTSTAISASNIFSATYGNPYYQGTWANATSNSGKGVGPGGFGTALYPATGGAGGAGGRMGLGGAGGRMGLGGLGGRGGAGSGDPGGVLVQLPIQITHTAIATFPVTPVAASQLQSDIAGMIARSSVITNHANVSVIVNQGIVTLRGTVGDLEEAKTIASMIRLTPGVRRVQNELTFPKQ
jgi:hypothetical protein